MIEQHPVFTKELAFELAARLKGKAARDIHDGRFCIIIAELYTVWESIGVTEYIYDVLYLDGELRTATGRESYEILAPLEEG